MLDFLSNTQQRTTHYNGIYSHCILKDENNSKL